MEKDLKIKKDKYKTKPEVGVREKSNKLTNVKIKSRDYRKCENNTLPHPTYPPFFFPLADKLKSSITLIKPPH